MSQKEKAREGASLEECLQGIDFLDLWNEKIFLGQEFLTWLWLLSEREGHEISLPNGESVEIFFEKKLELTLGQGGNKRKISITTPEETRDPDWDEAYIAVGNHKKISKGSLRVKYREREWRLSLPHDTLAPQGLKIAAQPKDPAESDDLSLIGKFMDNVALTAELLNNLESLLALFLARRLSTEWETEDLPLLESWLSSRKA
ncbi:MAG: hypothetical protein LBO66_02270 [Deltaproteobacteria bacterium]|nr:hypothetical protein [Deltaproteobacteria bacterium]